MHYESLYEDNQLSAPSIRNCGFEEAPSAQLPYFLYQTQPSLQAACLRESLLVSMANFQKLQNILLQANTVKRWKFYNIVICSLPDKVSKTTRKQMLEQIIRMNSLWAVTQFKTFFIPIDMGDIHIQEILSYCEIGGPGWQYYPTDVQNFAEVFRNVASEMSMINKRSLLASEASEQNFQVKVHGAPSLDYSLAVSLTIEASQNMAGHKWETIINTICFYMRNLGPRDLISGVVYNNRTAVGAKNQSLNNNMEPERMNQIQPQIRAQGYVPPQQYHPLPPQPVYNQNQQYAQYAQGAPVVRNPNQNSNGKLCGICCCLLIFGFVIRLIIVFYAQSN